MKGVEELIEVALFERVEGKEVEKDRRRSCSLTINILDLLLIHQSLLLPSLLQFMANRQRYHQAGVGSRTGLTVGDDVESVDDYLNAALKHIDRDKEYDDDSEEEEQDQEDDDDEDEDDEDGRSMMGPSGKVNSSSSRRGRPSAKNSSSMDIGQSEYNTSTIKPQSTAWKCHLLD